MSKENNVITVVGVVMEVIGKDYRVKLEEFDTEVLVYMAGKLQKNRKMRLLPGDKVVVELNPYDLTRGRIVRRITGRSGSDYVPKAA